MPLRTTCSLTSFQCSFLHDMKLIHVYKTYQLLVEWLGLGIYDFCSHPFAMKVHLSGEDRQKLEQTIKTVDSKLW